jgi:hypothetical protein
LSDFQLRRYSNQPVPTTTVGSVNISSTSITVASASGYPAAPFTIKIEDEVMLVTAKAGTVFTVEREFDGSSPAAIHPSGSPVEHVLTADDFSHRWQDVIVTRTHGLIDNEFDDGDSSDLSSVTLGSATWTESNGVLSGLASGQTSGQLAAQLTSLSSIPIGTGIQAGMRLGSFNVGKAGIVLASGVSTSHTMVFQGLSTSAGVLSAELRSGTFSAASTQHFTDTIYVHSGWVHLRLVWVSVNLFRAWWSIDGVSMTDASHGSFAITGISPPNYMGVATSSWGGSGDTMSTFEYLRIWEP